jgi:hypothetical protein
VRMTTESTDEAVAKRMLREHEARVTLKEPLVARAARVTYDELRKDLVEHYQATESRDLEEAGWRLKHLDRAFRGPGRARSRRRPLRGTSSSARPNRPRTARSTARWPCCSGCCAWGSSGARWPECRSSTSRRKPPPGGFFEPDAFAAVRAQLPGDLQVAVTLAYTFGWRMQSEVLTLELRQLDLGPGPSDWIRGAPRTTRGGWPQRGR